MINQNKDADKKKKSKIKEEISQELAVRKDELNRIRGRIKVVDPERGPENKSPHS